MIESVRRLSRRGRARLALAALASVGALALWQGPLPIPASPPERSDIAMYRAIVERLRRGEPYHQAVGSELRSRGYASREIFNWRTPLHLSTVATLSEPWARLLLVGLVAALAAMAIATAWRAGPQVGAMAALTFSGIVALTAAPDLVVMSETWAGVLIGGSVVAFAAGRVATGVALALIALFTRELAAPYCVAGTFVALVHRRWREVACWMGGAAAYAGYYGWHVSRVWPLRRETDIAHGSSWLELGGLPFILTTAEWLGWVFMLPVVWNTAALVLLLAGLAHPHCPRHARAAGFAYLAWFGVAGKPFDHYWGLVAAPAWGLACAFGLDAIRLAVARATASEEGVA